MANKNAKNVANYQLKLAAWLQNSALLATGYNQMVMRVTVLAFSIVGFFRFGTYYNFQEKYSEILPQ